MEFDELVESTRLQIFAQKKSYLVSCTTNRVLGAMLEGDSVSNVEWLTAATVGDAITVHISRKYLRYCEIVAETSPGMECPDLLNQDAKHNLYIKLRDNLLLVMKRNGIVEPVTGV